MALLTLSKCHTLVETSIEIEATPEQVWAVLADFESYPEWNPFITQISGSPELGETLSVSIQPPGGKAQSFKPEVTAAEAGHELRWLGRVGLPRVFDGRHYFVIDTADMPQGKVKFVHGESFEGMLVPFVARKLNSQVRQGFEQMNEALAQRVAQLYPSLLPGTQLSFLTAPPGAFIHRLQPSIVQQGAGGTAGYTSTITYFTGGTDSDTDLLAMGDQLITAGFDLKRSDSSDPSTQTDYYILPDGSLELMLGRFRVSRQIAETMAAIGRPVFPEGFPEAFMQGEEYSGYRIELRDYGGSTASAEPATDEGSAAEGGATGSAEEPGEAVVEEPAAP
ncbi:SRPBCC domain-containing protein [bacterium]|nr:SRPBCC domain-containing protein [bacterium]